MKKWKNNHLPLGLTTRFNQILIMKFSHYVYQLGLSNMFSQGLVIMFNY